MNQVFHHRNRVTTDCTSWDLQACTRDTLCRQCYVTTSKEFLINCHILLKYFEFIFLQLQLVELSCKLIIIWVNYERKKRGFYETPCIITELYEMLIWLLKRNFKNNIDVKCLSKVNACIKAYSVFSCRRASPSGYRWDKSCILCHAFSFLW